MAGRSLVYGVLGVPRTGFLRLLQEPSYDLYLVWGQAGGGVPHPWAAGSWGGAGWGAGGWSNPFEKPNTLFLWKI